jgi:hypothetical protein
MRYVGWLVGGFALYKLSNVLEAMGDAAPIAAEGVSGERLQYHGAALAVLIVGAACFIRGGYLAWRAIKDAGAPKPPKPPAADAEAEPEFDPDAAFAHYMETRGSQPDLPSPRPGGFGRKGL